MQKADIEISTKKEEKDFEERCKDPAFVVYCIRKYQRWRRGVGEYAFEGDPDDYMPTPIPFSGRALSIVEDSAIEMLEKYSGAKR